jgi:hypothetical protein
MMKRTAVRLALLTSWREHTHGKDDFGWGCVLQVWGLGIFLKLRGDSLILVASFPRRRHGLLAAEDKRERNGGKGA